MLLLMAISIVLGFFLGPAIPAFLITYAVFPIGWLANTVSVTGCAMALSCVLLISVKGGLIDTVSNSLGYKKDYKNVIKGLLPIVVFTLIMGIIWVLCADNLTALIL